MICSFKKKITQENQSEKSSISINCSISSRSASPMNRSYSSSNLSRVNFDESKMKIYSGNSSIDLENQYIKEIFEGDSNIKLDNSFSKEKSRKDDFLNIIDLINTHDRNSNHFDSHQENTKDSLIFNLDESERRNEKLKHPLSCSDLNILIKNFDLTTMKTSLNLNPKVKIISKVDNNLNSDNNHSDLRCKSSESRRSINSGRYNPANSKIREKANFIPKSEVFNKIQHKQENYSKSSDSNIINPFVSYYENRLVLIGNEHLREDSNLNLNLSPVDEGQRYMVSNSSFNNETIISNTTEDLFSNLNYKIDNMDYTNISNATGNYEISLGDNSNYKMNFNKDYACNARNLYLEGDNNNNNNIFKSKYTPESSDNVLQSIKFEFDMNKLFLKEMTLKETNCQPAKDVHIIHKDTKWYDNALIKMANEEIKKNISDLDENKRNDADLYLNSNPSTLKYKNLNNINYVANSDNIPDANVYRNANNNFNQNSLRLNANILPQTAPDHFSNVTSDFQNKIMQNIANRIPQFSVTDPNEILKTEQNFNHNFIHNFNKNNLNVNVNVPHLNLHPNFPLATTQVSATNYLEYNEDQLAENAYFFTKDQCLCRHLQKKINENHIFAKKIFIILKPKLLELTNDAFGNYLVQKLIDCIDDNMIGVIIDSISGSFFEVCSSQHGTRVIQKLIENLKSESLFNKFNNILTEHLIRISKDINANHIIYKYISTIKSPHNNFLYDIVVNNLDALAKDKHGCCVLQKCLECADEVQKKRLVDIILNRTLLYITDQYGNYVLQYLLSENNYEINRRIALKFLPNLILYSIQKFSSNVIERSFEHSDPEILLALVNQVAANEEISCKLMIDLYGNYVFQKALSIAKNENYIKLLNCVAHNAEKLKLAPFGQKLLIKLTITYKELSYIIRNINVLQNDNKISKNKMKRMAMNKIQHNGRNANPSANVNNPNANYFMQNKNTNTNNMIHYNNMNQMGNNNFSSNVNYSNPMMNGMSNNYQPSPFNISNFNTNNNNFPSNYNPNQMQPMAVNQYVNQVFYNLGNNSNTNNNIMLPNQGAQTNQPIKPIQAQNVPSNNRIFGNTKQK